jgi:hypothetical protein
MPKLPKNIAQAAEDAALQDFSALPAGTYLVKVREIDTAATTAKGGAKWVFQYDVIEGPLEVDEDARRHNGRLWEHCALSEAAAWKLKQIFVALGFTLDSDADELVGELCQVVVIQEEITQGNRKGQMGNTITSYLEATEDQIAANAA